jgi:hypothetical protein
MTMELQEVVIANTSSLVWRVRSKSDGEGDGIWPVLLVKFCWLVCLWLWYRRCPHSLLLAPTPCSLHPRPRPAPCSGCGVLLGGALRCAFLAWWSSMPMRALGLLVGLGFLLLAGLAWRPIIGHCGYWRPEAEAQVVPPAHSTTHNPLYHKWAHNQNLALEHNELLLNF